MKKKSKRTPKDPVVEEFLKRDLGEDLRRCGTGIVIDPMARQMPTSIILQRGIIEKLKKKAEKRGIGYQTMLKIIVHEHVDDY